MPVSIALYSTLPMEELALPRRFIRNFRMLPSRPQAADYRALASDVEFRNSLCCLLFFTRLVRECVFSTLETINFHPSLLPDHPGLSGYSSAISARELAVSAHWVDSSLDGGSILRQYTIVPFPDDHSAEQLQRESSMLCSAAILSILRDVPGVAPQRRKEFASGGQCIEWILSAEPAT